MAISTRTSTKTKAELKAEAASAARAEKQKRAARRNTPSQEALARRSAQDIAAAGAPQPKDNKQAKTAGIVARGRMVKNEGRYKGAGEIVRASAKEIETLRERGFLVDEGRVVLPMAAEGPQVLIEDERSRGVPEPR